jgi:hypothetical protein
MIDPFTSVAADVAFDATSDQRRPNLKPDKSCEEATPDYYRNPRPFGLTLILVGPLLTERPELL